MNEITLTIDMLDGNTYPLTLNWARLLAVETSAPEAAAVYKNILNGKEGSLNPLDIARMIYLGYLCGQAGNLAGAMPVEEFMEILPTDIQYLSELMNELISGGAKKKKNSATPSAGARKTSTKK